MQARLNRATASEVIAMLKGVTPQVRTPSGEQGRENYQHFDNSPLKPVAEHPVSPFRIDVDERPCNSAPHSQLRSVAVHYQPVSCEKYTMVVLLLLQLIVYNGIICLLINA